MLTNVPSPSQALKTLLRADFIVQRKNRTSFRLVLAVPIVLLFAWRSVIDKLGAPFVLSTCITVGLTAIGLMGYANTIAKDRDRGVFQRLRVTPVPAWCIMTSRLLVQLSMIIVLTLVTFCFGYGVDHIELTPAGYGLGLLATIVGGALYLSLGQLIAGLFKNTETVNATTRLVYFLFVLIGMVGQTGLMGDQVKAGIRWSPYGTVNTIIAAGLKPATWNSETNMALLATLAYTAVFIVVGIKGIALLAGRKQD